MTRTLRMRTAVTEMTSRLNAALGDRYRLERELGTGGMATVFLARDLKHDRPVALKVLRPDLAASLGAARFQREIQIAARLQHPNILPLLDSGEAGGSLYYVMPYVEGESLRDRLSREGALPVGDAVRILRDVVDALTEAHAHGVVHRDIKPENVLLRARHALVADFGVAKAVSEATGRQTLTTVGVALGTPAYMAPEQASADPKVDHRVDVYAVGAVAYEMLTGRPVFLGTTPQMVLAAHVTEAPVPVSRHREAVPPMLEAVVMRCLEKNPADRWQSAAELLPQLEALATPSGGVTPLGTRPFATVRRRRPFRTAVAAAGVVAAAVAAGVLWRNTRPRVRSELTRLPLTSSGVAEMPVISPDGSQVAYSARDCRPLEGCLADLVVRDLATEAEQPIVRGAHWITPLRYSPDGSRILFEGSLSDEGEGAFLVPRLGGGVTRLIAASDSLRGLDFLPGGDTVLAHVGGSLRYVLVAGGQVSRSVPLPEGFAASLRGVSGDGRWLAFERPPTYWGATTLLVADRGGHIVDSVSTPVVFGSVRWNGARSLLALEGRFYVGLEHALLTWSVNGRSGRASDPDTLLVALTRSAPDVSADGRVLVLGGLNAGESELWTLEPAPHGLLRPVRKVVGATGTLWGRMSADGRTLAYVVESGGPRGRTFRVFVEDFEGGNARALTPAIPVSEFVDFTITGYGDFIYVATRSGEEPTRVVAYEVATGVARPFTELPPRSLNVWERPGGGLAWYPAEQADTLHVLDANARTVALVPENVPAGASLVGPEFSPDATEMVLMYYEPAGGQRAQSEIALYSVSLAHGGRRLVARIPAVNFLPPPRWGDDGWIRVEVATPRDPRFVVYRVPAEGGSFEPEFFSPFEGSCQCSASRDGRRWVGTRQGERSDVVLVRGLERAHR